MQNQNPSKEIGLEALHDVKNYWLAGSWEEVLSSLNKGENCVESGALLLYKVSALLMLGRSKEARSVFTSLDTKGNQKPLLLKLLISGARQALSNARRCIGHESAAKTLSEGSLACVSDVELTDYWVELREYTQLRQMGVPFVVLPNGPVRHAVNLDACLSRLSRVYTDSLPVKVAEAEYFYQQGQYDESIRRWQKMASYLGEGMPQAYYERLKDAYQLSGGFPKGTSKEEYLYGDLDKHLILQHMHDWLRPRFYLEIGVQSGKSLSIASCPSVGIDPMPMLTHELSPQSEVVRASSDQFFSRMSHIVPSSDFDLSFVDGMHLFEYVLRDFINIEKLSHKGTVVVVDDIFPGHEIQARRERATSAWTGDVWKFFDILKKYRKDLHLLPVNAYPTGLLIIFGLDHTNDELPTNYDRIVNQYRSVSHVPSEYLNRSGAWDKQLAELGEEVVRIRQALT